MRINSSYYRNSIGLIVIFLSVLYACSSNEISAIKKKSVNEILMVYTDKPEIGSQTRRYKSQTSWFPNNRRKKKFKNPNINSGSVNFKNSIQELKNSLTTPSDSSKHIDTERNINIVVLQAGTIHSKHGNPGLEANFALFEQLAREAAGSTPRPDIICFPEYAISGWPYPKDIINSLAESIPGEGKWYRKYYNLAREIEIPILGWLVELSDSKYYNTAFMIDGKGNFIGKYRKVQANLGEQIWWGWSQGEKFELIELDGVRYGISICSDMWFPETVRCQELMGADVILHLSISDDMNHIMPVRAYDSRLPIVVCIFRGGSYAVDAQGKLLSKLPSEDPAWQSFQIFPFKKNLGRKYGGVWDIKRGNQNIRNVGAYSILTDPSTRPPWTEVFMDAEGNPQTREQLLKRFHGRYDARDPESGPKVKDH